MPLARRIGAMIRADSETNSRYASGSCVAGLRRQLVTTACMNLLPGAIPKAIDRFGQRWLSDWSDYYASPARNVAESITPEMRPVHIVPSATRPIRCDTDPTARRPRWQ